jgi:signal transduction histidine kinase
VASVGGLALQNATLRERREAALVEVGRAALSLVPGRELLQVAVDTLVRTLDLELAVAAEVQADGRTAVLRAGHGLKPGLVDKAVLPAMPGTPVRYLKEMDGQDQVSELLRDHGVVSGISTLVRVGDVPVAELGGFSTRPREFSQDDRQFLEHVTNLTSQALITIRASDALEESLEQLRRTDRARRELLGRQVTAVEDERAKIARDIHDDALQTLAGIALRLHILMDDIEDQDKRLLLERLLPALDQTMHRLRTLIFDMRADVLEEGLAAALRLYQDQVRSPDGPHSSFVSRLQVEPSMEIRLVIYRIAQEALRNVRKHAGAKHVEVLLESRDGGVQVTVRDDGRGFDVAEARRVRGHLGLLAMRERAELAGGEFRVESAPGRGTTVQFWIPIAPDTP